MDPSPDWAPAPHITARDTPGGAIVLNLRDGHCWELNRTAAKMWSLLMDLQSAKKAIAQIGELLENAPPRAGEDMARFVEQLIGLGMVVAVGDEKGEPPFAS
jgi:hypothetical protein